MIRAKHLQHCIRGGFWTRTGLTAEDVMRAEYLKDVADDVKIGNFHKAQQKLKAKHSYRLENECIGNKVTAAVCDVIFYKGVAFLACMMQPSTMLWAAYLGINNVDVIKSMPVLRDKFIKFFAFVKRGGYVLHTIASDPESAVAALFKTQTTFMNEGTSFVSFPKGHHDGLFEKKVVYLKEHVKFQEEKLASKVNISPSLLKCIVMACFIVNIMPTATNVNHAPPLFVWGGGKPIDYQRIFGKTTGLELVEANYEDANKDALTYTAISLYPTNLEGSWKHFNIKTGDTFDRENFSRAKWTDDYRRIVNETTADENARIASRITAAAEQQSVTEGKRILRKEKRLADEAVKSIKAATRLEKRIAKTKRSPPRTMLTKNSKISNLQAPTKLKSGDPIALPMHSRTNLMNDFAFATQMNFRADVKKHDDAAIRVMEKEIAGIDNRKTWQPASVSSRSFEITTHKNYTSYWINCRET